MARHFFWALKSLLTKAGKLLLEGLIRLLPIRKSVAVVTLKGCWRNDGHTGCYIRLGSGDILLYHYSL